MWKSRRNRQRRDLTPIPCQQQPHKGRKRKVPSLLLIETKGGLKQKENRGWFSHSLEKQIFTEGLLCAKEFLRDPAGNKGPDPCTGEVRVLWEQRGKHRAQTRGHGSGGI